MEELLGPCRWHAEIRRSRRTQPGPPPIDRNKAHRQLKRAAIEFLSELSDHHEPIDELFIGQLTFDLHSGAGARVGAGAWHHPVGSNCRGDC